MKKVLQNDNFIGVALAVVTFAVYLSTLATTVQYEDGGEIATSLYTLGIVHPTGYPLFTLLGWAFSHLPIGGRVIWKLSLLVAVLCSASVFFFYRTFLFLLSEKASRLFRKSVAATKTKTEVHPGSNRLVAAIAALVLAFSRTFWSEAVSVEVYALHLVFLSAVTLLFLRALSDSMGTISWRADRTWLGFAFVLGLSFTNHMMTVLLAPAFLYLFFTTQGFGRPAWVRIGRAIPPFLLGLSVYLYIPIRSSQHPLMNWGNPSTLELFGRHVSGQQYRYKMFSSAEVTIRKLGGFFSGLPSEFGYAPLLLAAVGLWALFQSNRRLLVFSLLLFLGCVFYSINYDFEDPNYYLNAYFATAIWILFGARALVTGARGRHRIGVVVCVACAFFPLALNFKAVNRSRDFAVEDYTRNMLGSLEPSAIVFSNNFESFGAPVYYLQLVEGVRPDVVVIDETMLLTPWYCRQLAQRYPWLVENSRPQFEAFMRENERCARIPDQTPADVADLKVLFVEMMRSIFENNYGERPLYVSSTIDGRFTEGFQRVPTGLSMRLVRKIPPMLFPALGFVFRPFPKITPEIESIRNSYATAYVNQGIYHMSMGDNGTAGFLFQKALSVDPHFLPALKWMEFNKAQGRQ